MYLFSFLNLTLYNYNASLALNKERNIIEKYETVTIY